MSVPQFRFVSRSRLRFSGLGRRPAVAVQAPSSSPSSLNRSATPAACPHPSAIMLRARTKPLLIEQGLPLPQRTQMSR